MSGAFGRAKMAIFWAFLGLKWPCFGSKMAKYLPKPQEYPHKPYIYVLKHTRHGNIAKFQNFKFWVLWGGPKWPFLALKGPCFWPKKAKNGQKFAETSEIPPKTLHLSIKTYKTRQHDQSPKFRVLIALERAKMAIFLGNLALKWPFWGQKR